MRPLRALFIYLIAVFVGGALLAPWLWQIAHAGGPWLAAAAAKPFQRFVTNSFMFVAVIGLWPFFRALGATSRREIGLTSPVGNGNNLFYGLMLGLVSLAPVVGLTLLAGGRGWATGLTAAKIAKEVTGAVFTAAAVSLLEEIIFRGGVFGGLRRVFDWRFALILSAAFYAATHFLADVSFQGTVTWSSGLELLLRMWGGFVHLGALFPNFLNLTLAGLLLGVAYQRTGNLYFSIGLHAGWVFWLACYRLFTATLPNTQTWFWGSQYMVDGWLAFFALSISLFFYMRLPLLRKEGSYGWR